MKSSNNLKIFISIIILFFFGSFGYYFNLSLDSSYKDFLRVNSNSKEFNNLENNSFSVFLNIWTNNLIVNFYIIAGSLTISIYSSLLFLYNSFVFGQTIQNSVSLGLNPLFVLSNGLEIFAFCLAYLLSLNIAALILNHIKGEHSHLKIAFVFKMILLILSLTTISAILETIIIYSYAY